MTFSNETSANREGAFGNVRRKCKNKSKSPTRLGHFLFSAGRQRFVHGVAALQVVPAVVHGSETHEKHEQLLVAQDEMFQAFHGHRGVRAREFYRTRANESGTSSRFGGPLERSADGRGGVSRSRATRRDAKHTGSTANNRRDNNAKRSQ